MHRLLKALLIVAAFLGAAPRLWAQPNITQAEYFFDNDPGFGNGTAISLTPAPDVTLAFSLDISALTDGFHVLYVRGRDASGKWSHLNARGFLKFSLVAPPPPAPNITQAEYFFDNDPGFGNGTAISLTPAPDATLTLAADISSLADGFHVLYVRGRDANGRWSHLNARGFLKFSLVAPPTAPNIAAVEYFIDRDPGFGRGTQVPITPAADLTQTFTIDLTTIPSGARQLYIRGRDANGWWSVLQMVQFNDTGPNPPDNGTATVNVTGNGTVDFPGTALQIVFSGVSGSGNVVVTRYLTPPQNVSYLPSPPVNTSQYRWVITNEPTLTAFTAQLRFDATQIPGAGIANPSAVSILARQNVGNGAFESIAMSAPSGNTIIGTVTSFSEFVLGSDASNPLPVELASFTATVQNSRVILNWTTASEKNSAGFEVQRRSENQDVSSAAWQRLGFIKGAGTTSEAQSYSFIDRTASGKVQYRLKQIDFDGQFEILPTTEVDAGLPRMFELEQNYPNPFNPTTVIGYQLPASSAVSLKVFDMLGREVATLVNARQDAGRYQVSFNGASLASGIYFYRLQAGAFTQTNKMMLVK